MHTKFRSKKLTWKRPRRRPRCKGEDNVMMDLEEMDCRCLDLIQLTEDKAQRQVNVNMA